MSFSVNTITNKGLELLTQATASNPVIFCNAGVCGQAHSAVDAAMLEVGDLDEEYPNGSIKSSSATGTTARIVAELDGSVCYGTFHTIALLGYLQNGSYSERVVVAVCSDEDKAVTVPSDQTSPVIKVQIPFNITLVTTGTVTTTPGNNASLGDLDRFVSCHVAGNSSSGETQNIRGKKKFIDKIEAETEKTETVLGHDVRLSSLGAFVAEGNAQNSNVSYNLCAAYDEDNNENSGVCLTCYPGRVSGDRTQFSVNADNAFIPGLCTKTPGYATYAPDIGSIILIYLNEDSNTAPGTVLDSASYTIQWGVIGDVIDGMNRIFEGKYKIMSYIPYGGGVGLAMRVE